MRSLAPTLLLLVLAGAAHAQPVRAFGVLRDASSFVPPCVLFEDDAGFVWRLDDDGGLPIGARVLVKGSISGPGLCGGLLLAQLDADVTPAFAGLGRLRHDDGAPRLVTPQGHVYALSDAGGERDGTLLFVEGEVDDTGRGPPLILVDAIGPGFASFGRLRPSPGPSGWLLDTAQGEIALERVGISAPQSGQFVYAEGLAEGGLVAAATPQLGAGGGLAQRAAPGAPVGGPFTVGDVAEEQPAIPEALRANTLRPARQHAATVVLDEGALRVKVEGKQWNDVFDVPDPGSLVLGERVFVSGRDLDDFDPLEDASSRVLRGARPLVAFSACGGLVSAPGAEPAILQTLEGELIELEASGPLPHGEARYVVGGLDPDAAGLRFLENRTLQCLTFSGRLEIGFECTPIFVIDDMGGFFNIEDPPAIPFGDPFTVTGGITTCDVICPFPCMLVEEIVEG